MRRLLFIVVALGACELQPPPKKQAEPAQEAQPQAQKPVEAPPQPTPPPPAPPPEAGSGAGSAAAAPPKIEITAPCMEVAAKLAQVFIDGQTDPAQKSIAEQARADMTRKMGEACTVQPWSEGARKCYLAAKNEAGIRACEKKFPAPQPPPKPRPPAATDPAAGGVR